MKFNLNPFISIFEILKIYQKNIGPRLYMVFVLSILASLADGFGITMLLPLLGTLDGGKLPEGGIELTFYNTLALIGIENSLIWILFIISILFIVKGVLIFIQLSYSGYLLSDLSKNLKEKMYDAYNNSDYCYYIKRNTGYYVNIFNEQINSFSLSFNRFSNFISSTMMTLGYLTFAFLIAWRFALMAVVAGIVLMALFRILNEFMRVLSRKSVKEMGQLNILLVQSLQAYKYITSTNQNRHLRNVLFQSTQRLKDYSFQSWMAVAITQAVREPVTIIFIITILLVQVNLMEGAISAIFVVIILFYRTIGAAITIQTNWQGLMSMVGSVELVNNEFKKLQQNQEVSGNIPVATFCKSIEFKDVSFSYDKDLPAVLENVNISIPANKTIAIVGESGAGKSTLIDLLTLLLKPLSGAVYIDGVQALELEFSSWRRQIGYVSQETVVFDDTIANNICLWQGDATSEEALIRRIKMAARQSHIEDFVESLPEGFQTRVGDRGVLLSGGQRQRLFIARELFKDPNLLILDEATSSLDSESELYIQASIDALKGSMTVVIIAHRLSTIRNADYVYILDQGRIAEEGSYEELTLKPNSKLAKMIAMQAL